MASAPGRASSSRREGFSAEAIAYVDSIDPKVVLIDGHRLAELMIDFDLGANTAATYSVKRVDSDYFDDAGAV
jgi:restriction system protein